MDLFQNLKNWTKSQNASTNPVENFVPGGQILGAPLQQLGGMISDHFTDYTKRNRNANTGELERSFGETILGVPKELIERNYGRDVAGSLEGKALRKAGVSLKKDGKYRPYSDLKDDAALVTSDGVQRYLSAGGGDIDTSKTAGYYNTKAAQMEKGQATSSELTKNHVQSLIDLGEVNPLTDIDPNTGGLTQDAQTRMRGSVRQGERRTIAERLAVQEGRAKGLSERAAKAAGLGLSPGEDGTISQQDLNKAVGAQMIAESLMKDATSAGQRDIATHKANLKSTAANIAHLRNTDDLALATFNEGNRRDSRDFRQRVFENNQAIDMEIMKMKNANEQMRMQYEYEQEANQQAALGNLLGGLFSLGGLL